MNMETLTRDPHYRHLQQEASVGVATAQSTGSGTAAPSRSNEYGHMGRPWNDVDCPAKNFLRLSCIDRDVNQCVDVRTVGGSLTTTMDVSTRSATGAPQRDTKSSQRCTVLKTLSDHERRQEEVEGGNHDVSGPWIEVTIILVVRLEGV